MLKNNIGIANLYSLSCISTFGIFLTPLASISAQELSGEL